jgi:DNA polymerase-1
MLAWDTETCLIRPGLQAPPLVVVSWAREDGSEGLVSWRESVEWAKKHFGKEETTLANAPYDLAVMGNHDMRLMPVIFDMLEADLVHDVQTRQKMYDIAQGCYSTKSKPKFYQSETGGRRPILYNLGCCHDRLLGTPMEKDEWRLRYAEFRDIPISQWPEGARFYSLEDSRATLRVHQMQNILEDAEEVFVDQFRQVRAHWAIHLMRCWGIRTDQEAVKKLDERIQKKWEEVKARLIKDGLIRTKDGSKNMKLAKRLMYETLGENCVLTDTGERKMLELVKNGLDEKEAKSIMLIAKDHMYVSTAGESCANADKRELKDFHDYVHLEKLRSTYVKALWGGVEVPIHSYFENILETGRTSSSAPNLQNPPREPGVRECFMPRPGCVFAACDYDLAELRALAQVCLDEIGYSTLADALNAGFDPHLSMAAQILGITYEEAAERRAKGDEEIEEMRTLGKCANFGLPGGLGAKTFVAFAKGNFGVTITEERAKELKQEWLEMWPEMREYFRMISNLFPNRFKKKEAEKEKKPDDEKDAEKEKKPDDDEKDAEKDDDEEDEEEIPRGFIKQHKSGRCRGRVTYTAACNTLFQGLTADAVKEAMFVIAREQFCNPDSPLYGTHVVNMIHDEIIIECREEIAHEVAMELSRIMVEVYNRWTPDVPMTSEPFVMRRWSKKAKPRWLKGGKKRAGEDDRLIPYEDAA